MLIETGTQVRALSEQTAGAGVSTYEGSVKSDTITVSVWMDSISSGSLTVRIYTLTDSGKRLLMTTLGPYSAGFTELVVSQTATILQRFLVEAEYDDSCSYEVYVRATMGGSAGSGGPSVQDDDCFVVLDELEIEAGAEVSVDQDTCLRIADPGQGKKQLVVNGSLVEYS